MFNFSKETRKNAGLVVSVVNAMVGAGTFILGVIKVVSNTRKNQAKNTTPTNNNDTDEPKIEIKVENETENKTE